MNTGSSPHTRGARLCVPGVGVDVGIIPAYAGSTRWARSGRSSLRDHPRIRGEHPMRNANPHGTPGSSPHTRGARYPAADRGPGPGIIPAYAGSTDQLPQPLPVTPDHPRIRGEHAELQPWCVGLRGSSPHTRGARHHPDRARSAFGIIPAYAGSTRRAARGPSAPPDHPRIRGEHSPRTPSSRLSGGSSPHTRGAPARPSHEAAVAGIIPAYAGSTLADPLDQVTDEDHPRIRGEH